MKPSVAVRPRYAIPVLCIVLLIFTLCAGAAIAAADDIDIQNLNPGEIFITAPEGGWDVGTKDFQITSDNACVVIHGTGNTVKALEATQVDEDTYAYTVDLAEDDVICITHRGDADLNGRVNIYDLDVINMYLGGANTMAAMQLLASDADANGSVGIADLNATNQYLGGVDTLPWA